MTERIPNIPPFIAPYTEKNRPRWSVMITTYNCNRYIGPCLRSVLAQDPGPDQMQIMVLDDASTDVDVKSLVCEIGKGRVDFYQHPHNVGSLLNFQTALNKSTGELIHLLHGDDMVKRGFYAEVDRMFQQYPEAGMVFTQNSYINEAGVEIGIKTPMSNAEGLLPGWYDRIVICNLLEVPAAVVQRKVYEQLGGYYGAHYGEDWEMWVRIARDFPVAYIPKVLAQYRKTDDNISANSHRNLRSIKDIKKIMSLIQKDVPQDRLPAIKKKSYQKFARYFSYLSLSMKNRNARAGFAMARKAFNMNRDSFTFYTLLVTAYCLVRSSFRRRPAAAVKEDESDTIML